MRQLLILGLFVALGGAAQPTGSSCDLVVTLEGLRNHQGIIRACLMKDPRAFPDCGRDPAAIKLSVPATTLSLDFKSVAPGDYALALFHDENANAKLDTILGIPREGFGFSRNPKVRFGAPRFKDASITIRGAITRLNVRLQYIL